jgi:hypothetical protein
VAERLLDDDPPPRPVALLGEAVLLELPDDVAEEAGRDREVEGVVAVRAAVLVELLDGAPEVPEGVVVVEVAASWRQTSSRNSVRAWAFTESCTICAKSWSAQSRRANPVSEKPGGSRPRLARS